MGAQSSIASIPVYVISLKDAHVRRANMTARLGAIGLPFQFVDAIDGRTARLPDTFDGARVDRRGFGSEAAVASTMSHRVVHRMIAERGDETALIFEDDARPDPDFMDVLATAMKFDFDIFKLEGLPLGQSVAIGAIGHHRVNISWTASTGAAAYLLRRSAAIELCSLPEIHCQFDESLSELCLRLLILELDPAAVYQDFLTPSQGRFQEFGGPPMLRRRSSWHKRIVNSVYRRWQTARMHGLGVLLALEWQKRIGGH